ncbi:MAG: ribosome-associated translation inhibitor RaiA [Candidatus Subteraquimicrobiales bacterium]|nr:ribosome-associated translation inhibitor RaiA [Candidatus Subteraquimicrobiales bacterium]
MQLIVKGKNIEVTQALRQYAEEKLSRVLRHFDQISHIEVEFIVAKNPGIANNQTVEVLLFTKKAVIKVQESSTDMYASIDKVVDKLDRQIKKYKGKLYTSKHKHLMGLSDLVQGSFLSDKPKIVKEKRFAIKPMFPDEAALQMELLGHSFFVFMNAETEKVSVVYKRKDNNYGLIEPNIETA